jgi:hypothetical protein
MVSTLSTHVTDSSKERLPYVWPSPTVFWAGHYLSMHAHSAGILKQSMGARKELSRNRVVVPAHQAIYDGGINFLESILGLLKSMKIWAQVRTN